MICHERHPTCFLLMEKSLLPVLSFIRINYRNEQAQTMRQIFSEIGAAEYEQRHAGVEFRLCKVITAAGPAAVRGLVRHEHVRCPRVPILPTDSLEAVQHGGTLKGPQVVEVPHRHWIVPVLWGLTHKLAQVF